MPKATNYTISEFRRDYPDEDACLAAVFLKRYGNSPWCPGCGAETTFYKLKNRKCYSCKHCGHHLYPLAGSIFHRSRTPLTVWFYAMYLFAASRNGVSALELERQLGVTYKTAWRMARQIRQLMRQGTDMLSGTVEADEAYIGGRRRSSNRYSNKTPLLGAVERKGEARVLVTDHASASTAIPFLRANVKAGSILNTDESRIYTRAKHHYTRVSVQHSAYEFVDGDIYTNTIEGFWGLLKPSLDGTYRSVSKKHLQLYVNEFVFRYNHRGQPIWPVLLEQVGVPAARVHRNVL